jgi:hypothetical protein
MKSQKAKQETGFWSTFWGMTIRPWRTLGDMAHDPSIAAKGVLLLVLITFVYTLILAVFITHDYPAAAPSVLPLAVEEQYLVQIWYQGPLFLVATALAAGTLMLLGWLLGRSPGFRLTFGRIAFASVIPFFFTTMLIEAALAVLMLVGAVQPDAVLSWLLGAGAWFPNTYQAVAIAWIAVLFVLTACHTLGRGWLAGVLGGLLALAVYALPVGLLIR